MCARFTLGNPQGVPRRFGVVADQLELSPRFNIAPSQFTASIVETGNGRALRVQRFGLIPSWSKDGPPKFSTINARAEEIEQKATYKRPFLRQRCLIPADGFYEWKTEGQAKQPVHICLKDHGLFGFAAVYDVWRDRESDVAIGSFSIVTTEPNELVRPIHNRMPVILAPEDEAAWLDPKNHDLAGLKSLLKPYPADAMIAYPVSPAVNRPVHDGPQLIESWAPGEARLI